MSGLPSMPFFIDDYEAATAHLTLEEDGAYTRLLRLCWRQPKCDLPDDAAWIMRRMRVDQATYDAVIRPIIDEFFTRARGRIFQKRLREEFCRVNELVQRRKDAGKMGGNAKAMKNNKNTASKATNLPVAKSKQSPSTHNHNQNHREEEKNNPPISPLSDFDVWWKQYPIKEDKKRAQRCYATACKLTTPDNLLAKAAEYIDFCQRTDRKMKHPCTWLNGENWNDELAEPTDAKSKVDRAFDNILARFEAADAGDAEADAGDLEGTGRRGGEHSVPSGSVIELSARRLA